MNISLKEDGSALVIENLKKITGPLGDKASASALKSCGYYLQQKIKAYGNRGSKTLWGRNNPHSGILKSTKKTGRRKPYKTTAKHYKSGSRKGLIKPRTSKSARPMSRIVNAARYVYDANTDTVEIGFVGSARGLAGTISAMGTAAAIPVTDKMRRYFWGIGFPLKQSTKWLYRRKRTWIEPVYEREQNNVGPLYEQKFISALERYGVKFE
jgi:hypothetical protein